MKRISLGIPITATAHPKNGPITLGDYETVFHNGGEVITATLHIERNLETLISIRFAKRRREFEERILRTNWFHYDAKRALTIEIAKEDEILPKEKIPKLEKALAKIGEYRNAFAHGRIVLDEGRFSIHYYRSGRQVKELNDEFFVSVGELFSEAGKLTGECINALVRRTQPSS